MGIPIRVLIVEDSQADADLLVRDLLRGGYDPAYDRVQTPEAMTAALDRQGWDIIFSDFTMPHFSGTDALNVVLGKGVDIPFIFVSGTIGEDTAVEAMKAGANDYIMKENLKRLIPAVERELRQAKSRNDLRQTEKAFRQSEARFRRIFESNMEGIIFWDFNGNITETNDAFLKIVGYTKEDVLMRRVHWKDMTPPQYDHLDKKVLDELAAKGVCTPFEKEFLHKDGRRIPIILGAALLDGFQGHGVSFVIDITDRKQAEVLVQQMAFYDTLTGLPNRNKLYDRLLNAIRVNSADGKPFALLLMDLDHFKDINDTLGHQRGDLLLKEVGVRLQSVLFEPDTVARLGGDEFGVVLSHLSAPDHIHVAIKKIEKALETPFIVEGLPVAVEASIGVAIYPDHGGNPDSLLQRADIAMYAAKEAGVGHLIYDAKLDKHSPRRLALMGELRNAIEGNQLVLHYQPKIGMKTGRIIGAEALVRWIHPEHGFIPPDQFIGSAEKSGLIGPLTMWVFETALKQSRDWRAAGRGITISINLSARNLLDAGLHKHFIEQLRSDAGPTEPLMLEITESAIMADASRALEAINRLRDAGFRFSIDDFGTGYSSLAYIKNLPVEEIKIDKSFIINMVKNPNDAVIVRSTIDLVHNLNLKVVAEGVESQDIWDRLSALGCDEAQGYYMAKPMPAGDFTRWLHESPRGISQ